MRYPVRLTLFLAIVGLIVSACTLTLPPESPSMANPASVHCEDQGGTLEMREENDGQYGVCIFEDGSECEEWAFFRGECKPGGSE